MSRALNEAEKQPPAHGRKLTLIVAAINVALLVLAGLFLWRYASVYQERLRAENLDNIANLNQSAAINATALVENWAIKLKDTVQYAERLDMTRDQALAWIEHSNSSDARQFELIGDDYTGYLARRDAQGAFIPLLYNQTAYADLQRAFRDVQDDAYSDVCFTPEFSDAETALKYFAVYRHVSLRDPAGGRQLYTLLLATKSADVLATFNSQNRYDDQSTVLIGAHGNYIVSSADFKSDNFFQYLYVYNDLTLDERLAIEAEVAQNGAGALYYRDAKGQDCVFRYERMTTNDWYCVTCVPIASFRVPAAFNLNFAMYAVICLALMLGTDIVWLQWMNRRLRASVLREKEASEAKTEFLSRMSHDIRTPLNGIIGMTTLALDEAVPPRLLEYLENIRVSGQFLAGLVNDILDLSKVESGKVVLKPEPYLSREMRKYVDAVVAPLCAEKGLVFRVFEPEHAPTVLLDRLRFNQIIFNLLSNAVKYTPKGGFVEFRWTYTELPEHRTQLDLSVRDNGIGMSQAFQAQMFDSFSQEHAQTASTGAGLGLAIVKSLVRLMDGEVTVVSEQGKGSTFSVRLEAAISDADPGEAKVVAHAALTGVRVLLCEDNAINTMVAKRMLEKWGMLVDTAENGQIGLDRFAASSPGAYGAILMDVMMPVMDGLAATRAIRALDRADAATVPILAMTANAYDVDVKNCLDAGMNAHMGKPIDQEKLHNALSEQIGLHP